MLVGSICNCGGLNETIIIFFETPAVYMRPTDLRQKSTEGGRLLSNIHMYADTLFLRNPLSPDPRVNLPFSSGTAHTYIGDGDVGVGRGFGGQHGGVRVQRLLGARSCRQVGLTVVRSVFIFIFIFK